MRTISKLCVCLALALGTAMPSVQAAPERPMKQAPGYFRYAVGDFIVTALQDGLPVFGTGSYQGIPPDQVNALIARSYLLKSTGMPMSFNAFLVDTGQHRILVDAGNAKCLGLNLNGVATNLRAAGYKPDEIDIIVLTHLHGDHFCALATDAGKRAYRNASVWVAQEEVDYWNGQKGVATQLQAIRALYGNDFRVFKAGDTIAAGLRIVPAHGHTPGHTAFLFESRGVSLMAWGDIVHAQPVQFPHPEVSIGSDTDRQQAVATRQALFERLAKEGTLIAGSHLPFPGIGHIRKEADGFMWIPVEFGPLPQ